MSNFEADLGPAFSLEVLEPEPSRRLTKCYYRELLSREGFVQRPSWLELLEGQRPPPHIQAEPGEWPHGWQYFASSCIEHHFLTTSILPRRTADGRAHLEEHSGPGAGTALSTCPSASEFTIASTAFRTLVLERLGLNFSAAFVVKHIQDGARA